MGEAKRRAELDDHRLYDFGPTLARKIGMDEAIAHLEALIEADKVRSMCSIAIVETDVAHVFKVEFAAHDASPRQAYEAVKIVMRQFEAIYGFAPDLDHDPTDL